MGQEDYSYATVASCDLTLRYDGKNISEINQLKAEANRLTNEIQTILELQSQGDLRGLPLHGLRRRGAHHDVSNTAVASDGWILQFGRAVPIHARMLPGRAC